MGPEKLFYEILDGNLEGIGPGDVDLLAGIGIKGRLFFKSTKGLNILVAYGYENGGGRFVVRLRSKENPRYDGEMAAKLREKGLCVAGFFGTFPVEGDLVYDGTRVEYYDTARWVGYDFGIQAKAAVDLLEKCGWRMDCSYALFASKVLDRIGRLSGGFFGRMHDAGVRYVDFQNAQNLAGEGEICLFDIHSGFLERTKNIGKYLTTGWAFFKYLGCYPKDPEHKKAVLSFLRAGFVRGLESSKAGKKLVERVREEIVGWG